MVPFQLYREDGKPCGIYACGNCRIVQRDERTAARCCTVTACVHCRELAAMNYQDACDACARMIRAANDVAKERQRYESAEKLTEWGGWVFVEGLGYNDGFFDSIEDLKDYCSDQEVDLPSYVWTCDEDRFVSVDVDDIKQYIAGLTGAYEDFDPDDLNGLEELGVALAAFCKANENQLSYEPNYKRCVLLTPGESGKTECADAALENAVAQFSRLPVQLEKFHAEVKKAVASVMNGAPGDGRRSVGSAGPEAGAPAPALTLTDEPDSRGA